MSAADFGVAAQAFKESLDAMGVGIAVIGGDADDDQDHWAAAIVIGRENVESLNEWHERVIEARS